MTWDLTSAGLLALAFLAPLALAWTLVRWASRNKADVRRTRSHKRRGGEAA